MTYEEAYMKCDNYKDLLKEVDLDIKYAVCINKDRLKYIEEACINVVKAKHWEEFVENE